MDAFVVRDTPLADDGISRPHNASGITRADLGRRNGTYDRVSTDDSILFDPADGPLLPFDREDPIAWCSHPSPGGSDVITSTVSVLDCGCRDNLGVDRLVITSPSEWSTSDQDSAPDRLFAVNLSIDSIAELQKVSGDYALDISLACYDEVSNEGTTSVSVTVDQTPPVVQIQTAGLGDPVNGSYVVRSSPVVVSVVVQDASGILTVQLNGQQAVQIGESTYSGTLTPEAGQVVSARVRAWDRAGHTGEDTAHFLYAIDLPTVSITSPVSETTYGATLDVLAKVVDPSSIPLASVTVREPPEFRVAAVTLAGATATVSLRGASSAPLSAMAESGRQPRVCISAANVAGLESEETCVTGFIVDIASPTGQIESPQSGTTVSTSSIEVGHWSRTLTLLLEGEKHIEVRAADRLGNHGIVDSVVIDVDTLPPTVQAELRRTSAVGPLLDSTRPVSGPIWLLTYADDRTGINGIDVELPNSSEAIGELTLPTWPTATTT
jgi:hypothetical protein